MNDQIEREFNKWVDRILSEHPTEVTAYNFNLYEHDGSFAVQLIGATHFDSGDPSWAYDEAFSSGEDLFEISHIADWASKTNAQQQIILNKWVSDIARNKELRDVMLCPL